VEIQDLKDHLDLRLDNIEKIDVHKHNRIDELLAHYSKEIDQNDETIKRIHIRVDRIDTKIKTVQGLGTVIATALGASSQVTIIGIPFLQAAITFLLILSMLLQLLIQWQ